VRIGRREGDVEVLAEGIQPEVLGHVGRILKEVQKAALKGSKGLVANRAEYLESVVPRMKKSQVELHVVSDKVCESILLADSRQLRPIRMAS
jgi:hypothetical protein